MISVVLSGGAGARLWPASRENHPKPFIKLADGQTLIHKAYARAKAVGSEVLTVTNRGYYFISRDEQCSAGVKGGFLLEPFGRNTAPAIALAAKYISEQNGSDSIVLVLMADHLIADETGFAKAASEAAQMAKQNYLVTFGVLPTNPETGFGYIEQGDSLEFGHKVARFVEKPDITTAQGYIASGKYVWNSGMLCFKAGVFLEELSKTAPAVSKAIDTCWHGMQPLSSSDVIEVPPKFFSRVPDISVDYAVMEKSDQVAVVSGNFGWNDIGSWNAIRDLVPSDEAKNRTFGEAIFVDSTNTFVQSEDRLVATIGVKDLMIIDTPDALLVAHSDKAQDVKKVVAQLKANNHETFRLHRTVFRPWGVYTVLEEAPEFKIKRIEVKPGSSLSLQLHHHRSEHWIVVSGVAKVTNGENESLIYPNESIYIPAGRKHRLENPGNVTCVIIEVQCGSYLGEDDIVRFEDKYGR